MNAVLAIGVAATAFWALALTVRVAAALAAFIQPGIRRRAAARADRPAVSVVVPVKNMEPELDLAFASLFAQRYPDFEVLITAAEQDSPAITTARQAASLSPHIAARFILGNRQFTLNPKVSNLAPAIAAAAHDLILIKDANIHLAEGQLGEFVSNLTPGTGMVCAIPIAVGPKTFWAEVECAMMNGHAAPLLMGASILRLDVGFGKVMLFDRRDYERVDGLAIMAPTFGDDHALAKALARIGRRTVFTAGVIRQAMGARTFRDVWERQLRWMVIRREEEPLVFFGEAFFGCLFTTLAGAAGFASLGLPALPVAVATPLALLTGETLVVAAKGWSWSWRYPVASLCREFMLIALWIRAWFSRKVRWAGQPFDVGGQPRA
jgi:ceramide glucosyltransferase